MNLKQYGKHRKLFSSVVSLLLIVTMILSFSAHVFAETPVFTGTEPLEVEENQTIDLLQGVTAVSPKGEDLQVEVSNVICETDENYEYDGSNVLLSEKAGSVYRVEYQAASAVNEKEIYTDFRQITIVPQKRFQPEEAVQSLLQVDGENSSVEKAEEITASEKGLPIIFEGGIHYIEDPAYPGEKITLFCMNNERHWPHYTEDMGDVQVPEYTEGYLTSEQFNSEADYEECMRRLSKLLYAGYPYNGERLYTTVDDSELRTPTESQFNEMLIPTPVLQTAFPQLGHHSFTYKDWEANDEEHLAVLENFIIEVGKLYPDGQIANGVTYSDITAMPFYKAAYCMSSAGENETPLEVFAKFYSSSYFVTEEQAYNSTQNAVWKLLTEYGIEDNTLESLEHDALAKVLDIYSERGGLLNYEPSLQDVHLSGDLKFTYNPKDGYWHSGVLQIIEPSEYNGLYRLELPKGMTAMCDNLTYVYGNEKYELVSDHQPTTEETFTIKAEFIWMKEFKQYAPMGDVEVNGKKFQNMVGAVIRNATVSAAVPVGADEAGGLSITKEVVGEENCQEEFQFELRLPYHTNLNGVYGDLEFHEGIALFSLKDGQTVTANNLPAGAHYEITEAQTDKYRVDVADNIGEIPKNDTKKILFTNTKYPNLSLSKTVTGENGDKTRPFTFTIQLKDETGNPVNGTYSYIGSIIDGFEKEAEKPDDGTLTFVDGKAEIKLMHGQQISLQYLPLNAGYVVTENEANTDQYVTTYNGKTEAAKGVLVQDTQIQVINKKQLNQSPSSGKDEKKPSDTNTSVKTGDHTNMRQYTFTAIAALIMIGLIFSLKKWKAEYKE